MTENEAAPISETKINVLHAAKSATLLLIPVLRSRLWLFLLLELISFVGEQYFRFIETMMAAETKENVALLATNAGLSISFDLVWHAIFFMIAIVTTLEVVSGHSILSKRMSGAAFNELLIENTRVMARVIFWLPFLIVPAAYRYVRLSMVSFVVLTDPDYEKGEVDALKRSTAVTKGHFAICLFALLVATLLEPIASSVITGGEISVIKNPIGSLISAPISMVLELWAAIFLFAIYARLAKLPVRV